MLYAKYALGAVGAIGILMTAGQARATTLQDLINAGTPVTAGGLVYSGFSAGREPAGEQYYGEFHAAQRGFSSRGTGTR